MTSMISHKNSPLVKMCLNPIMSMKFFITNSALLLIEDLSNLCNCCVKIITLRIKTSLENNLKLQSL